MESFVLGPNLPRISESSGTLASKAGSGAGIHVPSAFPTITANENKDYISSEQIFGDTKEGYKKEFISKIPKTGLSIEKTSDMAELWSQSVVVRSKCGEKDAIVFTVNGRWRLLRLLIHVVLFARPCDQVAARGERRAPPCLQNTIILPL